MNATATELLLSAECEGKRHKVTATVDGKVAHVDTLPLASAYSRKKFAKTLCDKFAGLDASEIDEQLLALATAPPAPAPTEVAEVDVSRVVRPELFHTVEVSGITVPVRVVADGALVSRWRCYLRWANGRREVADVTDRLELPDGSVLYVAPEPGEPFANDAPAWSATARGAWLKGAVAPDPSATFQSVCERINHFLDMPAATAQGTTATLALWVILTYTYPAWDAVPYLYVGGPLGSGKSRVLEVLQRVVFRPLSSSNLTAPTLFRTLHSQGGVLLLDEAERVRQATPDQQELQTILLSGYKRGVTASRLEKLADGSFQPTQFAVYGPKALACIAGLQPTLSSRCVPVMMFRSAANSPKPKRRLDADPMAWQTVRDDLHALALEHGPTWAQLPALAHVVPSGIGGRNYELWQPLLALAGWLEEHGSDGLLPLVQEHARETVANAKDDAVPEADEILLELLTARVVDHYPPTSAELLKSAQERDPITFKLWTPNGVTRRLGAYGITTPKKVNGERRYRDVLPAQLEEIQAHYGVSLGLG
jgi:hypothetical protein